MSECTCVCTHVSSMNESVKCFLGMRALVDHILKVRNVSDY